ncbi:lactonase family protein [Chloroflexi bacterium TSY]|nr:lactonase family protein [Chloroflexi bacterium TSY]
MAESTQHLLVFVTACVSGEQGAIHSYQLDIETGSLKPLSRTIDVGNPFYLAFSPDRRFLYSIHEPGEFGVGDNGQVAAYEVTGENGELTLLNRMPTQGSAACYLTVDATGQTLLAANYQNGTVLSYPIYADGTLGHAVSFMTHTGSSINPARQQEPHAHCIVISPDNRYAYVADLGIDKSVNYGLNAAASTLSPNRQPFIRTHPGAGPLHFSFHPQQPFAYVINELDSTITMFDYEPESGTLLEQQTISTLPDGFDGTSHCADLKITPDGHFLYGTNRGHDSIAAYAIADDGHLALIDITPSGAEQPQNLAITPDGRLLFCANMAGDRVTLFHIDIQTGQILPTAKPISISKPSCIMIR